MSRHDFKAMRDNLRGGGAVRVVTANQLFPTPQHVAQRAVELLGLDDWQGEAWEQLRILEPSAGTGALIDAVTDAAQPEADVFAWELSYDLCERLRAKYEGNSAVRIICADFLAHPRPDSPAEQFDAVLMNPPFERGAWEKHLRHAWKFVKPDGGRLVAVLPQAPSVHRVLADLCPCYESENLPDGTFAGTGARTLLARLETE